MSHPAFRSRDSVAEIVIMISCPRVKWWRPDRQLSTSREEQCRMSCQIASTGGREEKAVFCFKACIDDMKEGTQGFVLRVV